MANITVITSGNIFNVDFGDLPMPSKKRTFQKSTVSLELMEDFIRVQVLGTVDFAITYLYDSDTPTVFQIDSVNGVAPTSNLDLYNKLADLL